VATAVATEVVGVAIAPGVGVRTGAVAVDAGAVAVPRQFAVNHWRSSSER
jgi:hypothetical protein